MRVFCMTSDSKIEPEAKQGTYVFECNGHDYGCANDDTRNTGKEHISVTLNIDGSYPFFTVPVEDIVEVQDKS